MFKAIDGLSLDALRVFESAARQLSFTAAANELGSSQPAISQQPGCEDERDRRSKNGSKKEGKKQSGTAG